MMTDFTTFFKMIAVLEQHAVLSQPFVEAIQTMVSAESYLRDTIILTVGGIQTQIYFVVKGYAREIVPGEFFAENRTSWFWCQNDFIFCPGFFMQRKSEVMIEVYKNSQLLILGYSQLISLRERFSGLLVSITESMRDSDSQQRRAFVDDMKTQTKQEHVRSYMELHKDIRFFASDHDITTFFGIKDKSLYRYL